MKHPKRPPAGLPLFDYAFAQGAAPEPRPQRFRSVELFAGAGMSRHGLGARRISS